jgi:hypothetical protein
MSDYKKMTHLDAESQRLAGCFHWGVVGFTVLSIVLIATLLLWGRVGGAP